MMGYYLAADLKELPDEEPFRHWVPLLAYFLKDCDTVEIRVWREEADLIAEMKRSLPTFRFRPEGSEMSAIGPLSEHVVHYLCEDYLAEDELELLADEKVKWFTVNLMQGKKDLFHISHNGGDIYVPAVSTKEIDFIRSTIPPASSMLIQKNRK